MTSLEPDAVVELADGFLLIGPAAAVYVAGALERVERSHRLEGIRPPAIWVDLSAAAARSAGIARDTAKHRKTSHVPQFAQIGSGLMVGVGRVAELAGISKVYARQLCRRRAFATARRPGRDWLVDEDEVVAWALARAHRSEAAA